MTYGELIENLQQMDRQDMLVEVTKENLMSFFDQLSGTCNKMVLDPGDGSSIYIYARVNDSGIQIKVSDNRDCFIHEFSIDRGGKATVNVTA